MKISTKTKILLDASVLICAIKNPKGGSGTILTLTRQKLIKTILTPLIIKETQKNIRRKLDKNYLLKFYQILPQLSQSIKSNPINREIKQYYQIINQKDAHVLAAAKKYQVNYLITLDKKHFFSKKLEQSKLPFEIITPKQFLQKLREQYK